MQNNSQSYQCNFIFKFVLTALKENIDCSSGEESRMFRGGCQRGNSEAAIGCREAEISGKAGNEVALANPLYRIDGVYLRNVDFVAVKDERSVTIFSLIENRA